MARTDTPQIRWEEGFGNILDFALPLDEAVSWSRDYPGSEYLVNGAGISDSWVLGTHYVLQGVAVGIPAENITMSKRGHAVTGWNGTLGWRAFLDWATRGYTFRFFPDRTDLSTHFECTLDEPTNSTRPQISTVDNTRQIFIRIQNITSPFRRRKQTA